MIIVAFILCFVTWSGSYDTCFIETVDTTWRDSCVTGLSENSKRFLIKDRASLKSKRY